MANSKNGAQPAPVELVFRVPKSSDPGYLRRSMAALAIKERMTKEGATIEIMQQMIDFLSEYVEVPADRDAAREALLDASEDQLNEAFDAVASTGDALPLANSAS